jgi:large subunit ribosomal protein L11
MDFCKQFNEKTRKLEQGVPIPVVITVFEDRSFTFITKMPPMAALIKKAAGLAKGSGVPNKDKVGKLTMKQVEEVAKIKLPDLNTKDLKQAMQMVKGTARSMGVDIV